jgi:hypothetical protein
VGGCKPNREGRSSKEMISAQTFTKERLERQKSQQKASDKLVPEIGQVVVDKVHLLSQ